MDNNYEELRLQFERHIKHLLDNDPDCQFAIGDEYRKLFYFKADMIDPKTTIKDLENSELLRNMIEEYKNNKVDIVDIGIIDCSKNPSAYKHLYNPNSNNIYITHDLYVRKSWMDVINKNFPNANPKDIQHWNEMYRMNWTANPIDPKDNSENIQSSTK